MNQFEMSAVLYYADFLSLQYSNKPCTESCKYFFIHGVPMNIAYIIDQEPVYDVDDQWFQRSLKEYSMLKHKFGQEGAISFTKNICNLGITGSVNATQMMKYIHRYDEKQERDKAFRLFKINRSKKKYTHITRNDDGDITQEQCSKYVSHAERSSERPRFYQSIRDNQ